MKRFFFIGVPLLGVLGTLYVYVVLNWNYSTGERAGWVQKFSKKGWVCKTWEGELAMVSMPGAAQEKFYFTVWDEEVAGRINKAMGQRVSLHYDEKVGLPSSCFGETRHWVNNLSIVPEIPLGPGVVVPTPPQPVPQPAPKPGVSMPAPPQPMPPPVPAPNAPPPPLPTK